MICSVSQVLLETKPDIPLCPNNLKVLGFHTGQSVINFVVTISLTQSDAILRHSASWLGLAALQDDRQYKSVITW